MFDSHYALVENDALSAQESDVVVSCDKSLKEVKADMLQPLAIK